MNKLINFISLRLRVSASGILILLMLPVIVCAQDDFAQKVAALNSKSFGDKEAAINALAETADKRVPAILKAMLEGQLYHRDGAIVIVAEHPEGYTLTDAVTGADLGTVATSEVKRINLNNSLRTLLRESMARFDLDSADPVVRLAAITELTGNMTPEAAELLRQGLQNEQNEQVRAA